MTSLARTVVFRDEAETEMHVASTGGAKAFARQLIRKGKAFTAEPCENGSWLFTVYEENHPNKWEYA